MTEVNKSKDQLCALINIKPRKRRSAKPGLAQSVVRDIGKDIVSEWPRRMEFIERGALAILGFD